MTDSDGEDVPDLSKTGLYEHASAQRKDALSLWLFRKGKAIDEVGNFTVLN